MKFPTYEEMAQNVAEKALDEYEYNGKTLREWIEIISATELSTNLAEVGTDCISRQSAIEVIERARAHIGHNMERAVGRVFLEMLDDVGLSISKLPPIQPKRGRWIKLDMHRGMADHKCTACEQECYVPTCMGEPMYAFCPNCGAKMEE